jgi:AcrR family transcriptional regulator
LKTQYERADVVPLLAEVFRDFGYEGTSLNLITERTKIGKGSLYHFFPGGKEEMAAAVLESVDRWFEDEIFKPLRDDHAYAPLSTMWQNVISYFKSGGRVCLVGAFALDVTRDRFAAAIEDYFRRWIASLAVALTRGGASPDDATRCAEHIVLTIQGAIVLSRALNDPKVFNRAIDSGRHLAATLVVER